MKSVKIKIFIIVLLKCCRVGIAHDNNEGCACPLHTDVQLYCKADFALKAKILRRVKASHAGGTVYKIRTNKKRLSIFKLKGFDPQQVDIKRVYTPAKTKSCWIDLKRRKEYLLTGKIDFWSGHPPRLVIDKCGLNTPWKEVKRKPIVKFITTKAKCTADVLEKKTPLQIYLRIKSF